MNSYNVSMCGRYQFFDEKNERINSLISKLKEILPEERFNRLTFGEVAPGQEVCIGVWNANNNRFGITTMTWGFPAGKKLLINARSETLEEKPMFRDCRPCVIIAQGYYEWSKEPKEKYYFTVEETPLYMAGLYRYYMDHYEFVILTEEAQLPEKAIHNRQPVILTRKDAEEWCSTRNVEKMIHASVNPRIMKNTRDMRI